MKQMYSKAKTTASYSYTVKGVKYLIRVGNDVENTPTGVDYAIYYPGGVKFGKHYNESPHMSKTAKGIAGDILESLGISVD